MGFRISHDVEGYAVERTNIVGARGTVTIDFVFSSMAFSAARFFEASGVAQWYSGARMMSKAQNDDSGKAV